MKKIITIGIILLIIVTSAISLFINKKKSIKYIEEPLTKQTIIESVEASGIINPITSVNIGAQVSGMISALYADFNSKVTKG